MKFSGQRDPFFSTRQQREGWALFRFLSNPAPINPKGTKMKATQSIFFVEVTDTYAGEANYCWVHRFKVHATTFRGAIRKVSREMGLPAARINGNYGDMARYDFKGAAICAFVMGYEDQAEQYSRVVSI